MMKKILNTFKYSSFKISIQLNPLQWRWVPFHFIGKMNEWPDENVYQFLFGWIFLSIRVYIDDGSW